MSTSNEPTYPHFPTGFHTLKKNWGWILTLGILLVLLGTIGIAAAAYTTFITIFFLGGLMLAGGIVKLIYSFWAKNWSGFFLSLLVGILYVVAGVLLLGKPVQSAAALTLLMGWLFVVSGVFKIIAPLARHFEQWGWVVFSGIISLILGILILAEWPAASLWVIGLFVGIDLIIYGWMSIFLSIAAKNYKERL